MNSHLKEVKRMTLKVIKNETIVMYDVDDTLVLWHHPNKDTRGITFVDPHDQTHHCLVPHDKHIKLLKDFKARGYTIFVWSGGGFDWAETVVKTLGLEDYVDFCMTKPTKWVDDLSADEVLGSKIYLKDS